MDSNIVGVLSDLVLKMPQTYCRCQWIRALQCSLLLFTSFVVLIFVSLAFSPLLNVDPLDSWQRCLRSCEAYMHDYAKPRSGPMVHADLNRDLCCDPSGEDIYLIKITAHLICVTRAPAYSANPCIPECGLVLFCNSLLFEN